MYYKHYATTAGIFLSGIACCQSNLVIHNNAYIVIDNSAKVVIENPVPTAVAVSGTGANIITESEFDQLIWRVGTSTGNYTVPFTSQTLTKIPFTAAITGAGTGSGTIAFSTYPGPNYDNNTYRPTDVTNMYDNTNSGNNSNHVIDRFWIIDALGYAAKPSATFQFTYIDAEHLQAGNIIVEANLGAQRFNSASGIWSDYMPQGSTNTATNSTSGVPVVPADFFRSWTLGEFITPLAAEVAYFKSSCEGNFLQLEWQTLSESGTDHFEIEHFDGAHFTVIGFAAATGNGSGARNYAFQSSVIREGTFRLVEVDENGNRIIKSLLSASCVSGDEPVIGYSAEISGITMSFEGEEDAVETLGIFDAAGRLVYTSDLQISYGPNAISVSGLFLSYGMYAVRLKNGLNQITGKVIVTE